MVGETTAVIGRRANLAERIAAKIRNQLDSGELKPGDRLPTEQGLGRIYGVSRTVVREAIAALRADGRVVARQGSGVFVVEPPSQSAFSLLSIEPGKISSIIETLEMRAAVESEAAGLAAERRSPGEFAKIGEYHEAFLHAVTTGQGAESQDFDFHLAIAEATHNRHFVEFFRFLGARTIPRAQTQNAASATDSMQAYLMQILQEHKEIVDAISTRDARAAHAAMRHHLKGSQARYESLVLDRR